MARPPKDFVYRDLAFSIWANHKRANGSDAYRALQRWALERERTDCPSQRWVTRRKQEWDRLSGEKRQDYAQARWPESMQRGALPWEAASALLELIRLYEYGFGVRPSVALARWFWHATQAAPDAPADARKLVAIHLAAHEAAGPVPDDVIRRAEAYLAFKPWTDAGTTEYESAIERGSVSDLRRAALPPSIYDGGIWPGPWPEYL